MALASLSPAATAELRTVKPGNSFLPHWFQHKKLRDFLAWQWTLFVLFLPKDLFIFKVSLHSLIV